jgi:Cupin
MSLRRSNIPDRPSQPGSGGRDASSWLRAVRAEGIVLVRTRVAGRWGFEVEARDAAFFHFVTEGHAYVRRSADKTEVETADFGNQIVVRHLLSTLFVYVLREWADAALPLGGNWSRRCAVRTSPVPWRASNSTG